MRHQLECCLCHYEGYGSSKTWWKEVLLLALNPNTRSGKKFWVCRKCIGKHSKLNDQHFMRVVTGTTRQKS